MLILCGLYASAGAPPDMLIRHETPDDGPAIAAVVERAFTDHPHGSGTEAAIVRALRAADALVVSLVAEMEGQVRGYAAASAVQVAGQSTSWHGLGPVAVEPAVQGQGIGSWLIAECLAQLRRKASSGCVVLGEPGYYGRFGFKAASGLVYPGPPSEFFMALPFKSCVPQGVVAYHEAFAGEA